MPISAIRDRLSASLAAFAWDEWAQMGVSADARRVSPWAADPEAHFLFGLEIGRADPRLFDELLDWLVTNANVMSAQRLRNMSGSEEDEQLVEATLAWASRYVRSIRVGVRRTAKAQQTTPLFYVSRAPSKPDPAFLELGLLKPSSEPSGKSRRPDTLRPINFAFLVRQIFGVGSRAEVMRFLLTATVRSPSGSRPLFTTLAIAEAAGFAKRNVQETLNSLVGARDRGGHTRERTSLLSGPRGLDERDPPRAAPVVQGLAERVLGSSGTPPLVLARGAQPVDAVHAVERGAQVDGRDRACAGVRGNPGLGFASGGEGLLAGVRADRRTDPACS